MNPSDEDIKAAMKYIIRNAVFDIPDSEEIRKTYVFSERFLKKKVWNYDKKFILLRNKSYSKIAALIVIIISLALTSISVYAIYKIFQQRVNERNTDITIIPDTSFKTSIEDVYEPDKLPSGYSLIDRQKSVDTVLTVYSDQSGNLIYFSQLLAESESSIDNENTIQEPAEVNKTEAIYFVKHNQATIIFSKHGYVFKMTIADSFSKAEIVTIAESVIIIE